MDPACDPFLPVGLSSERKRLQIAPPTPDHVKDRKKQHDDRHRNVNAKERCLGGRIHGISGLGAGAEQARMGMALSQWIETATEP
jgi:hypothetical protein